MSTKIEADRNKAIEAFSFVKNIVESCHNSFHLDCAVRLMDFYKDQFGNNDLHDELLATYNRKQVMIIIP